MFRIDLARTRRRGRQAVGTQPRSAPVSWPHGRRHRWIALARDCGIADCDIPRRSAPLHWCPMLNAIFAAPVLSENAARVIGAAGRLEGVRLGVVTQDPIEKLPEPLRGGVAQHWRVADVLELEQLASAVEAVAERLGGVDR